MNIQSNELVSIIIPVYNMQDYLKRCVNSVVEQTYQNLQIILINDGSTDESGKICDNYAAEDSRVEVIHQANAGQSAARNAGLDRIKGQWVTFLDSDDYFSKHYVEQMLNACVQHEADISVCRYVDYYNYNEHFGEDKFTKTSQIECLTNREAVVMHFGKRSQLLTMACCKLYRASLWKEFRFPVGMIIEDVFVSHRLLYDARKIILSDAYLYAILIHPNSTMRKPFSLKHLDALRAFQEGVLFYEQVGESEFSNIARRVYCNRLFNAYGICKKYLPNERESHQMLRSQAVDTYREVRRVRSYIDLSPTRAFFYRGKQFIGRYCPALYTALFLKNRTYI